MKKEDIINLEDLEKWIETYKEENKELPKSEEIVSLIPHIKENYKKVFFDLGQAIDSWGNFDIDLYVKFIKAKKAL